MNIYEEVKDIPIEEVTDKLNLVSLYNLRRIGTGLQGDCPSGHASDSHKCFSINFKDNFFKCFHCGIGGSVIDLVMVTNKYPDSREAVQYLIDTFRPDLQKEWNRDRGKGYNPEHEQAFYRKAELYELLYEWGRELLFTDKAKKVRDYLTGRGYTEDLLKKTEWIYYPPDKDIRAYLKKERPEQGQAITELKLQGAYGDNFRLAFPYRDRRGQITGFMKRAIEPKGITIKGETERRYDSTPGMNKDSLYYLNHCRGKDNLVIVEGYPDVQMFHAMGLDNVVALGTGLLSKAHVEGLKAFRVKNVILALDNDEPGPGRDNTEKAITLLRDTDIRAYVVEPRLYGEGIKDPDELVKAKGLEAFKELIREAVTAGEWIARKILERYDLNTPQGKNGAVYEALEYEQGIRNPLDSKAFLDTLCRQTGYPATLLQPIQEQYRGKAKREALVKEYRDSLNRGQALLSEGDIARYTEHIEKIADSLKIRAIEGAISFPSYEEGMERIRGRKEGLSTGYVTLDKYITIPNGQITIIGGRPSHGKTTLLFNLMLNMVKAYSDKQFYFFSYEEPLQAIMTKLIANLSRYTITQNEPWKNIENMGNYLKGDNTIKAIAEAQGLLKGYMDTGRLRLSDESLYIDTLTGLIEAEHLKGDIGAVFVDYIQKVKYRDFTPTRQVELQRISNALLETAKKTDIPVIMGAMLGRDKDSRNKVRLDNLREAGDIEQDANLVLGLYNDTVQKIQDETEEVITGYDRTNTELKVTILKNRNGIVNQTVTLYLQGATALITDRPI